MAGTYATYPVKGGGGGGGGVTSLNSLTGAVTLAAGSNITLSPVGNTITIAAAGAGANYDPTSGATIMFDDMAWTYASKSTLGANGPFMFVVGNQQQITLDAVLNTEQNRTGIIKISSSSTQAQTSIGADFAKSVIFGGATVVAACSLMFDTLPNTGTDNYDIVFGYSNAWPALGQGPVLAVSPGLTGANWSALCYTAGSPTIANTGVPFAANTWYNLRIVVNGTGTAVDYYINGTKCATITTNIPTGATQNCAIGVRTNCSTSTQTHNVRIDWIYQSFTPTSARGTF